MGWFTVWAYVCAGGLSAYAAKSVTYANGAGDGQRTRRLWLSVAVLLGCLAINKQLDLQSLVTDIARVISRWQGWYEERREYQRWFVGLAIVGSASLAVWFSVRFRKLWMSHGLLLAGIFFLLTFIVVRAISFHHVDQFLRFRLAGAKMNWVLELSGIFLVGMAAVREIRKNSREAGC